MCTPRLISVFCMAAIGLPLAAQSSVPPLPALPVTFVFSNCAAGVTFKATITDWLRDANGNVQPLAAQKIVSNTTVSYTYLFWGSFTMTVGRTTRAAIGARLPDGTIGRPLGSLGITYTNYGIDSVPPSTSFLLESSNADGLGVGTGQATSKLAWTASLYGAGNLMPNGVVSPLPLVTDWATLNTFIEGDGQLLARPITQYGACPEGAPGKDLGYPDLGDCNCGDPIQVGTGNLFEHFVDYQTWGSNPLTFERFYNSLTPATTLAAGLGANWRSNYDRYLRLVSASSVIAERPDGKQLSFTSSGGVWTTDTDVDLRLTNSGTTWTLTDSEDNIETYRNLNSGQALLQSIRARNGYTQNLQYNSNNQVIAVSDSYSRQLSLIYAANQLQSVTTPDGLKITYGYTGNRLTSVERPGAPPARQTYLYENSLLPSALTGIIDENGNRYATWTYDSSGRALSSEHAGGTDLTRIAYNDADNTRTVTYPLGVQAVYKFTNLQGVPKVTEIDRLATATTPAAVSKYTYDNNGYLASHTDWNGVVTTYVNDRSGRHTSIVAAAGTPQARTTTITYLPTLRLPSRVVEAGVTTTFTYDTTGNLLTKTLTDTTTSSVPYSTSGQTRTWSYTWSNFLLASAKTPRTDVSAVTQFTYDSSGALSAVVNALGQTTRITQHLPGGLPQTIVDPNGVVTHLTYDDRLRLVTRTIDTAAGPLTTTFGYDAASNITGVTQPDGSALSSKYDPANRLIALADVLGQSTVYTLDAQGGRTKTSVLDAASAQQGVRSAKFDALGRLVQDIGGAGQITAYAYDGNGNLVGITDPLGRVTQQSFSAFNRLTSRTDPLKGMTTTAYDAHDRPVRVTDANGGATTYVYNGFGDLIQRASPDSGTTIYRYDANGNVVQMVDAAGAIANYTYDALDRIASVSYPGNTAENVAYTYDQTANGFGIGRLTSVTDAAGTLSRSYDERGDIIAETRTIGNASLVTAYTYDAAGRVASIAYPSGWTAAYTRDAMGRIAAVSAQAADGSDPTPVVTGVGYQPFGPVKSLTYGNGVAETRAYDADYRLTGLTGAGASAVQGLSYAYDAASNVTSIGDAVNAGANQSFNYDSLDRLTSAAGSYGSLTYTYDIVGNRLSQAGGPAITYQYAAQSNQLASVSAAEAPGAVGYTKTGNMNRLSLAADKVFDLVYNQAGRLASVLNGDLTVAQYSYDAFGRRLIRAGSVFGTTLYQYDRAGHLLEEADGDGNAIADYIYLGDTPVAVVSPASGQVYWLHTDMLGAPQTATDSSQNIVWSATYTPFGELTSTPVSIVQNLRLPGQEFDIETGLYHNGFRNYVPALGRYLETDPLGIAAGMNTYVYAAGNPLNTIDRNGLREDLIFAAPGSDQWNSFYTAPSVENLFTVGAHGNPYGIADVNGHKISAETLAAIIRSSPNYHEGEAVRLDACNTGVNPGTIEGSFAQQLANALHAPVWGPDNFVFSGPGRTPFVMGRMPNLDTTPGASAWVPDYSQPGQYILFTPKTLGDFNPAGTPVL